MSEFKDRSEMGIARTKSEVASWSLARVIKRKEDLRSTYLYSLIDYLLFKKEKVPFTDSTQSVTSDIKESKSELIKSNYKEMKYEFNETTRSLLSQEQDVRSVLKKHEDLSLKREDETYRINLGEVRTIEKQQTSFSEIVGKQTIEASQEVTENEEEYEVLLVGKESEHEIMHTQAFQEKELSDKVIAGSKFYEGVKQDQGIYYYYLRNVVHVIRGFILLVLCYAVYSSRGFRQEYNQEVMDMRVFRARCDQVEFTRFFEDYISMHVTSNY